MFTVYKAYGTVSNETYYGYCKDREPKEAFLEQARRKEDRADVRFLSNNNDSIDNITFEIVDGCIDEQEAWMKRNDLRAADVESVTGPTMWPGKFLERAQKEHPERVARWKKEEMFNKCATARKAYALGKWTVDQIKQLSTTYNKKQVVADLDKLTPKCFSEKYAV